MTRDHRINVPIADAVKTIQVSLNVTGVRRWRARLWLGARLFRLATAVIGCQGEIRINGEPI